MAPKKVEKDKNQHIQVVVRVRPLNSIEKRQGAHSSVSVSTEKKEILVKERAIAGAPSKTFTYDRVFGPQAKQIELYKTTVVPIIEEVLQGYNCTIFAYGQTGTGKTFTMEGEKTNEPGMTWENDPLSGIIPRAMSQLFSRLDKMECEYTVRVSFLEIYNEELIDLLGADSVDNPRLKIYEDVAKKGSCVIQGLEDIPINHKREVYHVLERGSQRRQTAATQMNAHSSRSHSVFMVTIHMKENSVEGEELLKTGKLNLVDLAGSECVGRSGAVDKRAREAGSINQSLLTLGRVITSLVEHAPHIPYRESKLTRLLQDSLGGRTKTSIIATISPASNNLEETLSTLDYAYRAKNITNKPEINQKLTKKAILKEYTEEIERLRKDLQASRDKNGIYIATENYEQMQNQILQQLDNIKEFEEKIELLNSEMYKLTELFTVTSDKLEETAKELEETSNTLELTEDNLTKTRGVLRHRTQERDEQQHLVLQHVKTETKLHGQASQLLYTADEASGDVSGLHAKLDRVRTVEEHNESSQEVFRLSHRQNIDAMERNVQKHMEGVQNTLDVLGDNLGSLSSKRSGEIRELSDDIAAVIAMVTGQVTTLHQSQEKFTQEDQTWTNNLLAYCKQSRETELDRQEKFHKQIFLDKMSSIQARLAKIDTDLTEFGQKTKEKVVDHMQGSVSFFTQHLTDLDQQSALVSTYINENTKQINSHISRAKENCESQIQHNETCADELLKAMSKVVSEMIVKQNSKIKVGTDQLCDDMLSTNQTTEDYSQKIHSASDAMKLKAKSCREEHEAECSQINVVLQHNIDETQSSRSNISDTVSSLENDFSQFTMTTTKICGSTCDELVTLATSHQETTVARLAAHQVASSSLCIDATGSMKDLDASQASQHKELTEIIQSQQMLLDQYSKEVSDWSADHHAQLEQRDHDVESFLIQELKKVKPTGSTPQSRAFSYPRTLVKTATHNGLLKTFRAGYLLEEAINTPLPDTSMNPSETNDAVAMLNFDDAEDEKALTVSQQHNRRSSGDSAFSSVSIASSTDPTTKLRQCESKENIMAPPQPATSTRKSRQKSANQTKQSTSKSTSTPKKNDLSTSKNNTPQNTRSSSNSRLPLRTNNH